MSKKKILRSLSVYTVVGFLPMGFAFLVSPFTTRYLTESQVGVISYFTNLSLLLGSVFTFGMDSAFSIFFFSNDPLYADKKAVLRHALLVQLLSGFTGVLISLLAASWIYPALVKNAQEFPFHPYFKLVLIQALISGLYSTFNIYYRDAHDEKRFFAMNMSNFLLNVIMTLLLLLVMHRGSLDIVYSRVAVTALSMLLPALTVFRLSRQPVQGGMLRRMLRSSMPLFLYILFMQIAAMADKFFVERYFDFSVLGTYTQAAAIAALPEVVLTITGNFFAPRMMGLINSNGGSPLREDMLRVQTIQKLNMYVVIFCVYFLIAISPWFIRYYLGSRFHGGAIYVPLLAYSHVFRMMFISYQPVLLVRDKTRIFPVIVLVSFVCSILFVVLTHQYLGIYAIAASLCINRIISVPIIRHFANREMPPVSNALLPLYTVGWIGFAIIIASYFLPTIQAYINIIPLVLLSAIFIVDFKRNKARFAECLAPA